MISPPRGWQLHLISDKQSYSRFSPRQAAGGLPAGPGSPLTWQSSTAVLLGSLQAGRKASRLLGLLAPSWGGTGDHGSPWPYLSAAQTWMLKAESRFSRRARFSCKFSWQLFQPPKTTHLKVYERQRFIFGGIKACRYSVCHN